MSKDQLPNEFIIQELARIRRDLDKLMRNDEPVSNIYSGKTTKAERQSLRKHIEELDRELADRQNKKTEKPLKQNTFKVGQIVELIEYNPERSKGQIQYIACKLALPSTVEKVKAAIRSIADNEIANHKLPGVCDRRACNHNVRSYVWVRWQNQKVAAYNFGKLRLMSEDELKPKIGRELSGRVGPWIYNADTKIWKRDGSDKEYTNDEFADEMYYEMHPYDREDGEEFVKRLRKM